MAVVPGAPLTSTPRALLVSQLSSLQQRVFLRPTPPTRCVACGEAYDLEPFP